MDIKYIITMTLAYSTAILFGATLGVTAGVINLIESRIMFLIS